jgi:hypothetical protein
MLLGKVIGHLRAALNEQSGIVNFGDFYSFFVLVSDSVGEETERRSGYNPAKTNAQ